MIPSINHCVLTQVLQALKDGNIRHCEALGFTLEELNELNKISIDELFFLSRSAAQFIKINIQHDIFWRMLAQAKQEIYLQYRINRAITFGGSIELLNHFFGLPSNEISAKRRLLGIQIPQGRSNLPSEQDDTKIWRLWQKYKPTENDPLVHLDAMMQIVNEISTKENAISLTVVWNRITFFDNTNNINNEI